MENYDPSTSSAIFAAIFAAFLIPCIIIGIILIIAHWRIFEKAGRPGWAAIIPIYNVIVLLEIIGKPVWRLILLLIPCVNIIFGIWMVNLLSKSFGQSEGFAVGLILLPFIFYPILAFGNYTYLGPAAPEAAGNNFNPYNPNNPNPFNPPPPPQE